VTPEDERLLERTLTLAERGRGTAAPNPIVGCVIARDGRLLGEGWHERPGERHAETNALAACGDPAEVRGATAYVSLEPCAHHGRQPPCADALVAAGIARVVVAAGDPTPRVSGRGLARLREAGVEVEVAEGEVERLARRQNAPFRVSNLLGRPYVVLKLAASLDGRTATAAGESRWLSSPESRRVVHEWRAWMDAVAVGSGTALLDHPRLTVRHVEPLAERQPRRLVFDRTGRVPAELGLERVGEADPADALRRLAGEGVTSLLVEGGRTLAAGLIAAGVVDSLAIFSAPLLLGGDARPLLGDLGVESVAGAIPLIGVRSRRVGPDLLVEAELHELP
jgi:diaminohydroxyphosphoribosylaminopyrimidine deaminase / 5-amino-6-(5-phosphoribosylamino)uracil reductase